MKTKQLLLFALIGAVPGLAGTAGGSAPSDVRTEVAFFEPEKFTDVRDSLRHSDVKATGYLERLREHIVKQTPRFVPPGYSLAVTFTDIDMAGEYEPWLGPDFSDIRIIKDIYPPRAVLNFRLVDPEGNIVQEGRRELRDTAFLMRGNFGFRNDPLRYEKAMIDDWLRAEFRKLGES
jgi:hypothetical protein